MRTFLGYLAAYAEGKKLNTTDGMLGNVCECAIRVFFFISWGPVSFELSKVNNFEAANGQSPLKCDNGDYCLYVCFKQKHLFCSQIQKVNKKSHRFRPNQSCCFKKGCRL